MSEKVKIEEVIDEATLVQKKLKKLKIRNILLSIFSIFCILVFILEGILIYGITHAKFDLSGVNLADKSSIKNIHYDATPSTPQKEIDIDSITNKLEYIETIVNSTYYYDKNSKKIEDGIFSGYVAGLGDKYAEYFPVEDFESFMETQSGEYYGIGAMVTQDYSTMQSTVTEIYANSPAEKAGMMPGDIFVTIDGKDVTGMLLNDLVLLVKGPEGTEVKIGVNRPSTGEYLELVAVRGKVEINNVSTKVASNNTNGTAEGKKNPIPENIGYIKIKEFTGKTFEQFKNTLDELEKKKVKGFIIDLRDNPGGELDVVLNMIDYIMRDNDGTYTLNQKEDNFDVGKTLAVYMKDKTNITDAYYCDDGHEVDIPIVILVNRASASASELFTRCLMDYNKAKSVGTKTYGKGVVQNMIPIYDGSAIKFTISGYFPPSGYEIDGKGIIPDYPIDESGKEMTYDEKGNPSYNTVSTISEASGINDSDYDDLQLKKAIEILK